MANVDEDRYTTRFSPWQKWQERQITDKPGIYALAISEEPLSGQLFSFRREIEYFGND